MAYILSVLFLWMDLRVHLCFLKTEALREPRFPAAADAAVIREWRGDDVMGISPVSGQPDPHLYLRRYRCHALEYVTGYVMERLFKVRYWDYSNQPFNIHGYICLSSSIAWGFLTIFMTHLIHKPIARAVLAMPLYWDLFFVFFVTVLFVYDSIVYTKEALVFGKSLEAMQKLVRNLTIFRYSVRSKMNTEDRLQAAKEELLDQIEAKKVQAAALTGMSMEELREKAGTKLGAIKENQLLACP